MGTSLAPRVAGWGKRRSPTTALSPAPSAPIGIPAADPAGPIGLTVELYLGDVGWTDISPYVYYRDRVRIGVRGRADETSSPQAATAQLTINNRDGRFTPRNATGPWYGLIGRNTPIRISRMQNGVRRFRYHGEVPAWPTTSDISGTDVYTPITAAGLLRRIQQGTQTLGSAMYRAYALHEAGSLNPVAYWPCEDGSTSTQIAAGMSGVQPMSISGNPNLASDSQFLSSLPLPVLNSSVWYGTVPSMSKWTDNVIRFLMAVPSSSSITDQTVIARIFTAGTVRRADLRWRTAGGLELIGYDGLGVQLFSTGAVGFGVNGQLLRVSMELKANGSSVDYGIETVAPGVLAATVFGGTLASASIGAVTQVVINPGGSITDTVIGHISVQPVWDNLFDLVSQLDAWNAENPSDRLVRVAGEQGIGFTLVDLGFQGNSVTMGYQLSETFASLAQQVADADLGLLYEDREQLVLASRTRLSLYNQGTSYNNGRRGLTLDCSQHQLSAPLNPLDDDAFLRNDVTAARIDGSFAQAVQTSGALSTQPPPDGVGDYATTYTLSVGSDSDLPDHAGWRLHLGTVDEPRYPTISLTLRHPQFTGNVDLLNQALTLDIGDLLVIDNPPPWLPPDPIRLIVIGISETLGIYEHDMVLNCMPESPWRVAMLDDPILGRADTDGSTLAAPVGPADTVLSVATTGAATGSPLWTTDDTQFPFDVLVGGERITVASIGTQIGGTDGTFESGVAGWNAGTSAFTQSSVFAHAGFNSGLLTPDGVTATVTVMSDYLPATAGQQFYASGWYYMPNGYTTVQLRVNWYTGSTGVGFLSSANVQKTVPAGAWTFFSATFTAPANTGSVRVEPLLGGTPAVTDLLYVDSIVLHPVLGPQPFNAARSVNGVVKPQPAGADVRLFQPMILSL